jgi:hypothetical protein
MIPSRCTGIAQWVSPRLITHLYVFANYAADPAEPARAVNSMRPGLHLMSAFRHADLADEPQLRQQFARIHVWRCVTKAL